MTVWWGLAGLLGLLGCCGLLRSHRAAEDDPLARYPVAREPATPNADAAHTPLMTPAITPEMLARPRPPVAPRQVNAVPEAGTIAGEIPVRRPEVAEASPVPVAAPESRRAGAGQTQLQPEHRPTAPETPPQQEKIPAPQPRAAQERPEPEPRTEKPARLSPGSVVRGLAGKAKRLLRRGRE
jgi:hypothetical protein